MSTKRALLHVCCGVCAAQCIKQLQEEGFSVQGYFFNPNIHPFDEYRLRFQAASQIADAAGVALIEGEYSTADWFTLCRGFEEEKEGGARCSRCFEMRLAQTACFALQNNFDYFTTTLTISPHKDADRINKIGLVLNPDMFLKRDFKKQDGFKKTVTISKSHNIYRQHYCGCLYSQRDHGT